MDGTGSELLRNTFGPVGYPADQHLQLGIVSYKLALVNLSIEDLHCASQSSEDRAGSAIRHHTRCTGDTPLGTQSDHDPDSSDLGVLQEPSRILEDQMAVYLSGLCFRDTTKDQNRSPQEYCSRHSHRERGTPLSDKKAVDIICTWLFTNARGYTG